MPKDNENIPFLGPVEPSEPQGFSAEQMIRCEECLRANPPTRITCLYCVAPLPLTEASARLRKPVLRPPEKHQLGYNTILLPQDQVASQEVVAQAAELLKLSADKLHEILSQGIPLPVARTASREEAELVFNRLQDLGLSCLNLSDQDLGLTENAVKRVKSMAFADEYLAYSASGRRGRNCCRMDGHCFDSSGATNRNEGRDQRTYQLANPKRRFSTRVSFLEMKR